MTQKKKDYEFISSLLTFVATLSLSSFAVMVAVGDFHRYYPTAVPTLSFWTVLFGLWAVSLISARVRGVSE